jgi:hypothetical protein
VYEYSSRPKEIIIITVDAMRSELQNLAEEIDGPFAGDPSGPRRPFSSPEMSQMLSNTSSDHLRLGRIRVVTVPVASKRLQMVKGILSASSDILVFSDDDAIWPQGTMLTEILACFENLAIGGVGTSQVVIPNNPDGKWSVWEVLAAFRLCIR